MEKGKERKNASEESEVNSLLRNTNILLKEEEVRVEANGI